MRTIAVLPIKSFATAKQRLSGALAAGARGSLVQAMFSDVLGALRRSTEVEEIAVVTGNVGAESIARGDGATVLHDQDCTGQSDATRIGIAYALEQGYERVLLVPGDTPLLDPSELDSALTRAASDAIEVTIMPDRHGTGTNGLLIAPPDAFDPSFGEGSLARHVESAKTHRLAYRVLELPSLAHDVDTAEDLMALWPAVAGSRRVAQRTRGTLSQLEHSGSLHHPDVKLEV